jgi:uncharacterized protein YjbI with pentapeptide repeats
MANAEHMAAIQEGTKRWNKWRYKNSVTPDLKGADLSRKDLRGMDLSRADLSGADLTDAALGLDSFAKMERSHVFYEVIERNARATTAAGRAAKMERGRLFYEEIGRKGGAAGQTNLYKARLVHTNLSGANLSSANLRSANLRGAVLRSTAFNDVDLSETKGLNARARGLSHRCGDEGEFAGIRIRRHHAA